MQTFRRRVLDVAHVEIQTSAIEKKSAVAWRFLIVAVMQIDRAGICLSEKIILNLGRPQLRIHVRFVFAEQTAICGLDSNDPIHWDQLTHRIGIWLSEKPIPLISMLFPKRAEVNDTLSLVTNRACDHLLSC